ncbi:MAG: four helix bundle protein [Bacteroidales bacterium]|nr:four helix bundle protein [Candidatus Minthousia equi]MDO4957137.1 four helix bundle protein [Bacteroidales bacterium]
MATVNDFEELAIYKKSRELAKLVYEITRQGDFCYDTRFVQQIRASVGSVSDNIAEGFERQWNKEFIYFLYISKGSCGELRSQINRAYDVGFISDNIYNQLYSECRKLSVGILNMINSLKTSNVKGTRNYVP